MSEGLGVLEWLEKWYECNCDGEWEHDYGIAIQTTDNPGWWVKVDLRRTDKSVIPADRVLVIRGEPPSAENGNVGGDVWIRCEIKGGRFDGAGDPTQLRPILACFRSLVEGHS